MLSVNQKMLKAAVTEFVGDYYKASDTDIAAAMKIYAGIKDNDNAMFWMRRLVEPHLRVAVMKYELANFPQISISPDIKEDIDRRKACVPKKYTIIKPLPGNYRVDKFLLRGNKVAKVVEIYEWEGPKKMLADAMLTEVAIARRAGLLGIGPKLHDAFVCCSSDECSKVLVSDYVPGIPLNEWLAGIPSPSEALRTSVKEMIRDKLDKMHSHGVVHSGLTEKNVIVKKIGARVVDVVFTDYQNAFDLGSRRMWDSNKFVKADRNILNVFDGRRIWEEDSVTHFVIVRMLKDKRVRLS